jgi:hypothetical protein
MLRDWPQASGAGMIEAKWPKNLALVLLTGFFAIGICGLVPLLVYLKSQGQLPEDLVKTNFTVAMVVVGIFGLICLGGFISSVKNYFNPFTRFIANHEGMFMNITLRGQKAFFVAWHDLAKIEKTQIKRTAGRGATHYVDALGIFIKDDAAVDVPQVKRGVENSTDRQINFPEDTLDKDLDQLLQQLNDLKKRHSS